MKFLGVIPPEAGKCIGVTCVGDRVLIACEHGVYTQRVTGGPVRALAFPSADSKPQVEPEPFKRSNWP